MLIRVGSSPTGSTVHVIQWQVILVTGIYKITNLINQKSYIGQSVDIERRWKDHRKRVQTGDNVLYRAIRKYGIDNFSFEVIQECSPKELNELERYYVNLYDTYYNGYNSTLGGDSSRCYSSPEQIKGIINDLKNTSLTQQQIADKWQLSVVTVQGINTGRYWKQDLDYPIRKIEFKKNFCPKCGKEILTDSKQCASCWHTETRVSERPDRDELKNKIRIQSFCNIGKEYGVSDNAIRKWCDAYGLPRTKKEINSYSNEEWDCI